MKIALSLLILLAGTSMCAADAPAGEWVSVDLRSIEGIPAGCVRLWIEERGYALKAERERVRGISRNLIRATPLGTPSLRPECKWPEPATNPIAHQMRIWGVVGKPDEGGGWQVAAQPLPGEGNMKVFKTEEFKTLLVKRGDRLFDGTGDPAEPNATFVFRRPALPPAEARATLEDTVRRLHTGACLEITSTFVPSAAAAQACDVRRRILDLAGNYLTLSVISATEFDRMPDHFPGPSTAMKRQRGVHFSFTGQYEKQRVLGDAIMIQDGQQWRLAFLWF